ncbi:hypothetical protein PoB_004501800 [Plakobranchus ocellatus]|uniref:MADF domain-containing protein n=1 Tax=Plakobranchus ocellatus TaxID=259542 RepID=A0AAV4BH77_9GAST|nr:hypothetical protein PoB_004501800 [Plakobranchus ocellatus]
MASWSKERTLEFILHYKSHECLWKVNSKDYANRVKREKSYDALINFVKTFYPAANKDTIITKISNLRGSWRKENKKMMTSLQTAASPEDAYEPSLFYFNQLSFIGDSKGLGRGLEGSQEDLYDIPNIKTSPGRSQTSDKDEDPPEQPFSPQDVNIDVYEDDCSGRSTPSSIPIAHHNTSGLNTTSLSRAVTRHKPESVAKRKRDLEEEDLLMMACKKLNSRVLESLAKDECESFGQTVAHGLRSLSQDQFIHAKKLISDVLYEGQLGTLSRSASVRTDLN